MGKRAGEAEGNGRVVAVGFVVVEVSVGDCIKSLVYHV